MFVAGFFPILISLSVTWCHLFSFVSLISTGKLLRLTSWFVFPLHIQIKKYPYIKPLKQLHSSFSEVCLVSYFLCSFSSLIFCYVQDSNLIPCLEPFKWVNSISEEKRLVFSFLRFGYTPCWLCSQCLQRLHNKRSWNLIL